MKVYSKIVGILLTLAGISALIAIIIGIIESNNVQEKVEISLLFIPAIIFLHYMYIHNFGFNLKSEIPKKNYRFILVLTIASLITSIIIPAGYLFKQINIEKDALELTDRGIDKIENANLEAT